MLGTEQAPMLLLAVSHQEQLWGQAPFPGKSWVMSLSATAPRWQGMVLHSCRHPGQCLLLPSALAEMLLSKQGHVCFISCLLCFQGNKIPQARTEVSHLNGTQATNQSCSALPVAQCSQPGCLPCCRGCQGSCSPCWRSSKSLGAETHPWGMVWAMGRLMQESWGSGCWQEYFGVALTSFYPPSWQSPPGFGTRVRGGRALTWQGPALALPWLLPMFLSRVPAPKKVEKSSSWSQAPLLPRGQQLPRTERRSKPCLEPCALIPTLLPHHGQGLETRLPVAYSICWEPWGWTQGA